MSSENQPFSHAFSLGNLQEKLYDKKSFIFSGIAMVAFSVFGINVYRYGIFYALSFLLGYYLLNWIGAKSYFRAFPKIQGLLKNSLDDLLLVIVAGVILGGRIGHVLIYGEGYYFTHLSAIFKVREGGMSFIGGIIGVVLAVGFFFSFFEKGCFCVVLGILVVIV